MIPSQPGWPSGACLSFSHVFVWPSVFHVEKMCLRVFLGFHRHRTEELLELVLVLVLVLAPLLLLLLLP